MAPYPDSQPGYRRARALSDRYRHEREVGSAGKATVYLADDFKHGRKVAIMSMHSALAEARAWLAGAPPR